MKYLKGFLVAILSIILIIKKINKDNIVFLFIVSYIAILFISYILNISASLIFDLEKKDEVKVFFVILTTMIAFLTVTIYWYNSWNERLNRTKISALDIRLPAYQKAYRILYECKNEVKKFLEIDYPRSRAAKHYANFLALCATGISNYKRQLDNPGVELRGILMIKILKCAVDIEAPANENILSIREALGLKKKKEMSK